MACKWEVGSDTIAALFLHSTRQFYTWNAQVNVTTWDCKNDYETPHTKLEPTRLLMSCLPLLPLAKR